MPSSEYYYDPDPSDFDEQPGWVTCKFCGTEGLHWHENQHWALITSQGAIHVCGHHRAAGTHEFSILED